MRGIINYFFNSTDENETDEIREFSQLVANEPINASECFSFYQQNFLNWDDDIQRPNKLLSSMKKLFCPYLEYFCDNLNESLLSDGLKYIDTTLKFVNVDRNNSNLLCNLIINLLKMEYKDEIVTTMKKLLKNELIIKTLLGKNLKELFKSCFSGKKKCAYISEIMEIIRCYKFEKNTCNYNDCFQCFLESFNYKEIIDDYSALDFIGYIIKNNVSQKFLNDFLPLLTTHFYNFESADFFENYLITSNETIWDFLGKICCSEKCSTMLLSSVIMILSKFLDNKLILNFPVTEFIKRVNELNNETQEKLFIILNKFDNWKKTEFVQFFMPVWETKVKTQYLSNFVKSIDKTDEMISILFLNVNITELKEYLSNDKYYGELLIYYCKKLCFDIYPMFTKLLLNLSPVIYANDAFELLIEESNIVDYTPIIINFMGKENVDHNIFKILSKLSMNNEEFVKLFIETGISNLFKSLKNIEDLCFLVSLVADGPYEEIDEYLSKNFERTILSKLNEEQLYSLMLGLDFNQKSVGILRIPSLLKYVHNFQSFDLPYDRYIFGKYGTKYINSSNRDHYTQYIEKNDINNFLNDAHLINMMTNINIPFAPIYQCHFNMPHAYAKFQSKNSLSFWFYINSFMNKVDILQTCFGKVSFDCDGLSLFNEKIVEFDFQKWNMLTLVKKDNKILKNAYQCYFNGKHILDINPSVNDNIMQFGSHNFNNSIWFLHSHIISKDEILSAEEIQKMYQKGIPNKSNENENFATLETGSGFKYVEYNGIGNYLDSIGGSEFIFDKLFEAENKQSFTDLFMAAMNLYKKQLIEPNVFRSSLRYIMIQKREFISPDITQIFINNLNFDDFKGIFSDYQIISLISLDFSFLPMLFKANYDFSELMDFLLDSLFLLEIDGNVYENIIESIRIYLVKFPMFFEKIILFISSFDNLKAIQNDNVKKILFEEVLKNFNIFIQNINFKKILKLGSLLQRDLSIIFLERIIDYCINTPSYFSYKDLKQNKVIFNNLLTEEKMWCCLFSLLTFQRCVKLDDFYSKQIMVPEVLKLILDLLANLIPIELSNELIVTELLSNKILNLINSFSMEENFVMCEKQIIRLCSLGFDDYENQTLLSGDIVENISKPNLKIENDNSLISQLGNEKLNLLTDEYIQKTNQIEEVVNSNNIKVIQIHENLLNNLMEVISKMAARVMTLQIQNSIFIKKIFSRFTISGFNVLLQISTKMHILIIKNFFEMKPILADDSLNALFEFLITPILCGLWDDNLELLIKISLPLMTLKSKSAKVFILSILKRVSSEKVIDFLVLLFDNQIFITYLCEQNFFSPILKIICRNEIIEKYNFSSLKNIIVRKMQETEFANSLIENHSITWFINQPENKELDLLITKLMSNSKQLLHNYCMESTKYKKKTTKYYINKKENDNKYISEAIKYQFIYRLNSTNNELENSIIQVFRHKKHLEFLLMHPKTFMVVNSSQPLAVPLKLMPLIYHFDYPSGKFSEKPKIPISKHLSPFKSNLQELKGERYSAFCLQNWNLPFYVPFDLYTFFKTKFNGVPKNCNYLPTPEVLKSVYILGTDTFYLLTSANIDENNSLILNDEQTIICNFLVCESPIYGYNGNSTLFCNHSLIYFKYSDVVLTIPRRYAYRNISVDIFLENGISHTIVFNKKSERRAFLSKIKTITPKFQTSFGISFAQQLLSLSKEKVMKLWVNNKISTFDYLLYLNTISGRSFLDYSQYPVFPWILGDFQESKPKASRDLSMPMGGQTLERAERFKENYVETHYHYGTHYSHPAAVLHYMLRIEPFTLFEVYIHNGLDHCDRMFSDIAESWMSSSSNNQADVKELIPQFYCFPTMFENNHSVDLKTRTDGKQLNTVLLPSWAKTTIEFIYEMRKALEESDSIEFWIDLIFGYKQRGKEAIEALNVFQPLSYDDYFKVSQDANMNKKAAIDAIINFGQCPMQIFTNKHPSKKDVRVLNLSNCELYISQLKSPNTIPTSIYPLEDELIYMNSKYLMIFSPDYHYVGKVISNNLITIETSTGKFIQSIYTYNYNITNIALSSQHFLVCAASNNKLILFDISTGYFIRETELDITIKQVLFDEVHNLIFAISRKKIMAFRLDFQIIASYEQENEFTCISSCSSELWCEFPYVLAGHIDGSCYVWKLNINNCSFENSFIFQPNESPIKFVLLFNDDKTGLVMNENGELYLLSVPIVHQKILRSIYYQECPRCKTKSPGSLFCCSICGLYYCKNCRYYTLSRVCYRCSLLQSGSDESSGSPIFEGRRRETIYSDIG